MWNVGMQIDGLEFIEPPRFRLVSRFPGDLRRNISRSGSVSGSA